MEKKKCTRCRMTNIYKIFKDKEERDRLAKEEAEKTIATIEEKPAKKKKEKEIVEEKAE